MLIVEWALGKENQPNIYPSVLRSDSESPTVIRLHYDSEMFDPRSRRPDQSAPRARGKKNSKLTPQQKFIVRMFH